MAHLSTFSLFRENGMSLSQAFTASPTTTLRLLTPSSAKNVWRFVGCHNFSHVDLPFFQDFNWVSEQSNPKPWESFFELILDLRYFDIFQTTKMVESDARYDASDDERKTIFFCASAKKLVFGISCLLLSFEVDLPIFSYEEVI